MTLKKDFLEKFKNKKVYSFGKPCRYVMLPLSSLFTFPVYTVHLHKCLGMNFLQYGIVGKTLTFGTCANIYLICIENTLVGPSQILNGQLKPADHLSVASLASLPLYNTGNGPFPVFTPNQKVALRPYQEILQSFRYHHAFL